MKKYKCPSCSSTFQVIRHSKRGKSIRYKCKKCVKYFSIKTIHVNTKALLNDHLDGVSFRKLARKYDISPMTAWRKCEEALQRLPANRIISATVLFLSGASSLASGGKGEDG